MREGGDGVVRETDLVKGMAALGDDVRFFARESEAEAERLETDGTLFLVVESVVRGYDWEGSGGHCCVRMVVDAVRVGGSVGIGGAEGGG